MYDDRSVRLGTDTPGVRAALVGLTPGARILDAACGIGIDTVALSRRGFRVSAADANAAMVAATSERARSAGFDIAATRSGWSQLPQRLGPVLFDAVICTGNSISHASTAADMITALDAFRQVLAADGVIVIDTHDWEMIRSLGDRVVEDPVVVERNGVRCSRSYRWRVPEEEGRPVDLQIQLSFSGSNGPSRRTYTITQHTFTRAQMTDRLHAAGLRRIQMDADPDDDRYTIIAGHR